MTENQLCTDIVRRVSVLQPEKRGQFFHVSNERNSKEQAWTAKSIGIFAGVSDFLYFELQQPLIGIEVKVPDSRHNKDHIQQQVDWGRILESQGGIWRMVTSVYEAENIVVHKKLLGRTLDEVQLLIDECKTKTIKISSK